MIHLFRTSSITSIAYKTPKRNEKTQEGMNRAMMKWNLQYEKLVEFKQINGHCIVPRSYEQDKAFGAWVSMQRRVHTNNTIRLERKELLDELGFVWRVAPITAHTSTMDDVRGLVIGSSQLMIIS